MIMVNNMDENECLKSSNTQTSKNFLNELISSNNSFKESKQKTTKESEQADSIQILAYSYKEQEVINPSDKATTPKTHKFVLEDDSETNSIQIQSANDNFVMEGSKLII